MSIVDFFIQQANTADQAIEAEKQTYNQTELERLREAIQPHLAQFVEAGATIGQADYATGKMGKGIEYYQTPVILPGFESFWVIATIWNKEAVIRYQGYDQQEERHLYSTQHIQVNPTDEAAVGRFLRQLKQTFKEKEAQRREKEAEERRKQAKKLKESLQRNHWHVLPPSEAGAALAELAQLAPAADCAALREGWQAEYDKHLEVQAQEEAEAAKRQAEQQAYRQHLDTYRAAYMDWKAEMERIQAINRERFPALQARWNTPIEVYDLHYALYIRDEDEERVSEDTVTCLSPYRNGFHVEIKRNGKLQSFLYNSSHVVKMSAPYTAYPVNFRNAGRISVAQEAGEDLALHYPPGVEREKVEADLQATFEPLPAEPDRAGLDYEDVRRVWREESMPDENFLDC